MFDITLQVIGIVVNENPDNVEVQLIIGLPLPFGQQNGQPITAPAGVIRYFMGKKEAMKNATEISEIAEKLEEQVRSNIDVVTDPNEVADINKAVKKI